MEPLFMTADHGVRPRAARPAAARPASPEAASGPGRLAVAALVCGLLGLCVLPLIGALLALGLGSAAGRRADRGEAGGRGMATAAIVLGIIGCVCGVLALVVAVVQFSGPRGF